MPETDINYWAVLAAAAGTMVLGFVWYARPVFGDQWMALLGKKPEDFTNPGPAMLITFLGSLISAFVMSNIIDWAGVADVISGAIVGIWLGAGIVGMALVADYMFAQQPRKLMLINASYQALNLVLMGAILGALQ